MAKTIDHLTLTVGVTAYEHEGCQYDALLIIVAYNKGRGFCVRWQPVKLTGYGYQTGPMPSSDPLVGGGAVVAMEATKNSVKTLEQMRANLEAAHEGIRAYFDARELDIVNIFLKSVAKCGYTYDFEKQVKDFINKQNNTTMATVEMNSETKNVQNAQVTNETIDVNVGEVTVDSIMPVMQPVEGAPTKQEVAEAICKAANEGKATTVPLGSHGTLVIAGVGESGGQVLDRSGANQAESGGQVLDRSGRGRANQATCPPDSPKVQDSVPQTSAAYRVVLVPSKDGSGQWPKLYGFASEDAAEKMIKRMAKSIRNSWDRDEAGEKRFYIKGGKKYCSVFQELCNALNAGDKAAIDKACKRTVAIYDGAVADGKKKSGLSPDPSPKGKGSGYSDQDVADMLRKVMAGGDVPENIKKLLAA